MGNTGTRTDQATIYVQASAPLYDPNMQVKGSVYIEARANLIAPHIELIIKAKEKVTWEEVKHGASGQSQGDKIKEKVTDSNKLISPFTVNLYSSTGSLPPGNYEFPFNFKLPENLPGSFSLIQPEYKAQVIYSLIATLAAEGISALKFKNEIIVNQKPENISYLNPVECTQKVCMLCIPKGQCKMECNFQADNYKPGDIAYVFCKANNSQCSTPIKIFVIRLIQTIKLRTKEGKEVTYSRCVVSKDFDGQEANKDNSDYPKLLNVVLSEVQTDMMALEAERLKAKLQPNVRSLLIDCVYNVEVSPKFDVSCSCFSNFPVITLPLYIHAGEQSAWFSKYPPNFNPKVFDEQGILLPMGPHITGEIHIPSVPTMTLNVGPPSEPIPPSVMSSFAASVPIVQANLDVAQDKSKPPIVEAKVNIEQPAPNIENSNKEEKKIIAEAKIEINIPPPNIPEEKKAPVAEQPKVDIQINVPASAEIKPVEPEAKQSIKIGEMEVTETTSVILSKSAGKQEGPNKDLADNKQI